MRSRPAGLPRTARRSRGTTPRSRTSAGCSGRCATTRQLRTFVQRSLDAILDHDRDHRSQFLATIEAYCEHGGRMAETARSLHLQRQSLYKRLARIEEFLDGELADPDTRLGLHLALLARRYMRDDADGSD